MACLTGCGGGSENQSSVVTPETPVTTPTPTPPRETEVFGHLDIVMEQNEKRSLFLGPEQSYLYNNVSNDSPPSELMCETSNNIEAFTADLVTQTLIFNCIGGYEGSVIITLELNDSLTVTYDGDITETVNVELDDIVRLTTPKLKESLPSVQLQSDRSRTGNYVRDFFLASTSSDGSGRYFVIIRSIDRINNGLCTTGHRYDASIESVEENTIYETSPLYPVGVWEEPSDSSCNNAILPMTPVKFLLTLNAKFFSLDDDSVFIVMDGFEFFTMDRVFINN